MFASSRTSSLRPYVSFSSVSRDLGLCRRILLDDGYEEGTDVSCLCFLRACLGIFLSQPLRVCCITFVSFSGASCPLSIPPLLPPCLLMSLSSVSSLSWEFVAAACLRKMQKWYVSVEVRQAAESCCGGVEFVVLSHLVVVGCLWCVMILLARA